MKWKYDKENYYFFYEEIILGNPNSKIFAQRHTQVFIFVCDEFTRNIFEVVCNK